MPRQYAMTTNGVWIAHVRDGILRSQRHWGDMDGKMLPPVRFGTGKGRHITCMPNGSIIISGLFKSVCVSIRVYAYSPGLLRSISRVQGFHLKNVINVAVKISVWGWRMVQTRD